MRVLALCSYPEDAAATRFRLVQFVEPLKRRGIELVVRPFLDSQQFKQLYEPGALVRKALRMTFPIAKRLGDVFTAGKYDVLLVQREAMLFGPGMLEWLARTISGAPMVLDLDDATYVHYVSPTYGRLGSSLKFFGKTDNLIRRAEVVVCGNRSIAEYVETKGTRAVVVPTVVNLEQFKPKTGRDDHSHPKDIPVVGWIGTHSTFPFLESVFPVLEKLALKHKFCLRIVGAHHSGITLQGVDVDSVDWELGRDVESFSSLDIGLYPIVPKGAANEDWINGKSGFKAIQYMAVGVPFVMSPVGACGEIGIPGTTHFNATSEEDWYTALDTLLSDDDRRNRMGMAGRKCAVDNFGLETHADMIADVLRSVAAR